MPLEQKDLHIKSIFKTMAPYLNLLTSGFSFGLDHVWRARAVSRSGIRKGDRALDVCCGTGELAFRLSRRVGPQGSVTGADFVEEMLPLAKAKAGSRYPNVSFILADAKTVPFPDKTFDAVTVAFGIRNIPDTDLALKEITRVLKPGGIFLCLELTKPEAPLFGAIYEWYVFKVMPFISKLVMKTDKPYQYLPRSIDDFYSPHEFTKLLAQSGFTEVTVHSMTMGIATIYRAIKS